MLISFIIETITTRFRTAIFWHQLLYLSITSSFYLNQMPAAKGAWESSFLSHFKVGLQVGPLKLDVNQSYLTSAINFPRNDLRLWSVSVYNPAEKRENLTKPWNLKVLLKPAMAPLAADVSLSIRRVITDVILMKRLGREARRGQRCTKRSRCRSRRHVRGRQPEEATCTPRGLRSQLPGDARLRSYCSFNHVNSHYWILNLIVFYWQLSDAYKCYKHLI